jgi:hypothetical protein
MRAFAFAVAAGMLVALPLPVTAAPLSIDLSSQSIQVGPGGVRVGHDRWDSRRRDRRVHDRRESRGGDRRGDRRCVSETTTRTTPSGRVVREKRTVCR